MNCSSRRSSASAVPCINYNDCSTLIFGGTVVVKPLLIALTGAHDIWIMHDLVMSRESWEASPKCRAVARKRRPLRSAEITGRAPTDAFVALDIPGPIRRALHPRRPLNRHLARALEPWASLLSSQSLPSLSAMKHFDLLAVAHSFICLPPYDHHWPTLLLL